MIGSVKEVDSWYQINIDCMKFEDFDHMRIGFNPAKISSLCICYDPFYSV